MLVKTRTRLDNHCYPYIDHVIVRTATHSTYKVAANLTQILNLNFRANFHQEFELFSKKNYTYNYNGGHFKFNF